MTDNKLPDVVPPEIEAEFTSFNALCFDAVRVEAAKKGQQPPFWLCMSPEARAEACQILIHTLNDQLNPFRPFTEEEVRRMAERQTPRTTQLLAQWRAFELEAYARRQAHDPSGFFCPAENPK